MQNYSKAAAGNYSFEIDRPSGIGRQSAVSFLYAGNLCEADLVMARYANDAVVKSMLTPAKQQPNITE